MSAASYLDFAITDWQAIRHLPWGFISRFGESVLLLPCALGICGWLRYRAAHACVARWLLPFSAAASLVLASKVAYMGWGIGSAKLNFTGISGHSMMAASVLPVLAFVGTPARWPKLSVGAAVAAMSLAILVGVSRLALHAHSVSEVAVGLVLGFGVSVPFMRRGMPRSPAPLVGAALAIAVLMAMPVTGGASQRLVEIIAMYLSGRDRPYQRGEWTFAETPASCPRTACRREETPSGVERNWGGGRHIAAKVMMCPTPVFGGSHVTTLDSFPTISRR